MRGPDKLQLGGASFAEMAKSVLEAGLTSLDLLFNQGPRAGEILHGLGMTTDAPSGIGLTWVTIEVPPIVSLQPSVIRG